MRSCNRADIEITRTYTQTHTQVCVFVCVCVCVHIYIYVYMYVRKSYYVNVYVTSSSVIFPYCFKF
jgi:hypothetical protein